MAWLASSSNIRLVRREMHCTRFTSEAADLPAAAVVQHAAPSDAAQLRRRHASTPHTPPPAPLERRRAATSRAATTSRRFRGRRRARSDENAAQEQVAISATRLAEPAENGFSRFFSSSRSRLNVLSAGRRPRFRCCRATATTPRLARAAIAELPPARRDRGALRARRARLVDVDLAAAKGMSGGRASRRLARRSGGRRANGGRAAATRSSRRGGRRGARCCSSSRRGAAAGAAAALPARLSRRRRLRGQPAERRRLHRRRRRRRHDAVGVGRAERRTARLRRLRAVEPSSVPSGAAA